MSYKQYYNDFKNLPKITNNHIHLLALLPIGKFIKLVKKIDNDIYQKINILDIEYLDFNFNKYTLTMFDEQICGIPYKNLTKKENWIKLSEYKYDIKHFYKINKKLNRWNELERICSCIRFFICNYIIYYYYWYQTLYLNYKHNVFYINVRSKPGNICQECCFNDRFYISSKLILSCDDFINEILKITEITIKKSDYKYLYTQYKFIKYESDIILFALQQFNNKKTKLEKINPDELSNMKLNIDHTIFNKIDIKNPIMFVQYIMTFPKPSNDIKNINEANNKLYEMVKLYIIIAIIINKQYGFIFFNGIDFVKNEQETNNNILYCIIQKFPWINKYGINLIPHIGELNIKKNLTNIDNTIKLTNYLLKNNINRFGHGLIIPQSTYLLNYISNNKKHIYIEFNPISNQILKYFKIKYNPHKQLISNKFIKLVICSDDNGFFNYSTVTTDYLHLYIKWKLSFEHIKQFIINGIELINEPYKTYYINLFNALWNNDIKICMPTIIIRAT